MTPAGKKIYIVQYRMGGRGWPTRRVTIGPHGVWTPVAARERAIVLLRGISLGTDPRQAVRDQKAAEEEVTVATHAAAFLDHKAHSKAWRPGTQANNAALVRRWVVPALGDLQLHAVGKQEIARLFDTLPSEAAALRRSLFALLRPMFGWGVERGAIERNPFDAVARPPAGASRDRVLTDAELSAVFDASSKLDPPFDNLIRMLIITGQRRDEVGALTWDELDQDSQTWVLPGNRAKNHHAHIVPLSALAMQVLSDVSPKQIWPKAGYVFTTTGDTAVSGYSKTKARLDRFVELALDRKIPPWRLHDLRRTVATNLQRLGVRLEVTEAILNHVGGSRSGIVGVYQLHDWRDEKRAALDMWGEHLRGRLTAGDGSKVL